MAGYGDKPFGLSDIKLVPLPSGTAIDLPAAQRMTWRERVVTGELKGDDAVKSIVTYPDALEGSLEAGGISLEAWALMTGRTATSAGTTPDRTLTLTADAGEHYPYFKIYGKSVGDTSTDDVHVKIFKAKLSGPIEGEFSGDAFFVTRADFIAIDDGANGLYEVVQNETAANLPTS